VTRTTALLGPASRASCGLRLNARAPRISVVIKALNEEAKIASAIESVLAAGQGQELEIVLADSLSTDRTVEIASRYPVRIVQLQNAHDRGCGAAAQLGYQHARGEYVYVLDGDMEMDRLFLRAAVRALEADPGLAGVAGLLRDARARNHFDRHRIRSKGAGRAGSPRWLDGGGLYRRAAIEQVAYLCNRNLPAFEEAELGLRLTGAGWALRRLDMPAVKHTGHDDHTFGLLVRHWRSGYAMAGGILLRSAVGTAYFLHAVLLVKHPLAVIVWWALFAAALAATDFSLMPVSMLLAAMGGVFIALLVQKRSFSDAVFSLFHWHYSALALLVGLLRPQRSPAEPISSRELA